jgi:cell division septation protein DedD
MVTPNRRERRSEGRPVVIAVILITVAIVSFALGFMAGRGRTPEPTTEIAVSAPRQPISATNTTPAPEPAATPAANPATDENLTFFDTLPKGEQPPLGSGINMPPAEPAATTPTAEVRPAATKPAPAAKPAPAPTKTVAKTDAGPYILQVSSSRNPDDAGVLLGKLEKKGYQGSVQHADLGAKGIWYRVFVGPVPTRADADALASKLKSDMKLEALVRKQ